MFVARIAALAACLGLVVGCSSRHGVSAPQELTRLHEVNELLRAATGKPLDPKDFEAHLTARYLSP